MRANSKMRRHQTKQELSKAIYKTFLILFSFSHISTNNCTKVNLKVKETKTKSTNMLEMKNSIRVERGIYFNKNKQENGSSEIYYPHKWSFVQTINDTLNKVGTISNEQNSTTQSFTENKSPVVTTMKNKELNNPREIRNVFEVGNIKNLCHLCDCKTGDNVPCNINNIKNNNSHKGKLLK